ncbi:hypothetical protein MycrhDRAFT_5630 [Mycolicibacterium rhodesiae JS60]|nr:hypothetical protein MycrhDRAFT_5630 [Mycolicibacterium rhodesiae JS60]
MSVRPSRPATVPEVTLREHCREPYWPDPVHQHRCAVPNTGEHQRGTAEGDDFVTEIHRCACGFTWVVN